MQVFGAGLAAPSDCILEHVHSLPHFLVLLTHFNKVFQLNPLLALDVKVSKTPTATPTLHLKDLYSFSARVSGVLSPSGN